VLPTVGLVYVDANCVIYAVEKIEPYCLLLEPLWAAAAAGQLSIVTSELTWLETLVKPLHDGSKTLEKLFRDFLSSREVQLVPTSLDVWEQAARLRSVGLRTPDAVHAASSIAAGCDMFLTNDTAFQRVPNLPVTILRSLTTEQRG